MENAEPVLRDSDYYKKALEASTAEESVAAKKLHEALSGYVSASPAARGSFSQTVTACYWEFLKCIMPCAATTPMTRPRQMLVRFAAVVPSLFTDQQKALFSSAILENETDEAVYYLDEWFRSIAAGSIEATTTDSKSPSKTETPAENSAHLMRQKVDTAAKLQQFGDKLDVKQFERAQLEAELKTLVESFVDHEPLTDSNLYTASLTPEQKRLPLNIANQLKALLQVDDEIALYIRQYRNAAQTAKTLGEKIDNAQIDSKVSAGVIRSEVDAVFEMSEETIGGKGNPFAIFSKEFFHCESEGTGFRENIIDIMSNVEAIDPGVFCRIHKNEARRVMPFVLLIPSYGDIGFCREPFSHRDVISSRGRIVIPMYPKNLQTTVLTALGDLRWQTAKEKASFHWMSEGLTGAYYEWFAKQKLKGDIKEHFINSYITWITKESNGLQQLEGALRSLFWKHIPFSKPIVEKLKTRIKYIPESPANRS